METASLISLDATGRTDVGARQRRMGAPDEDTVCVVRFHGLNEPGGVRALYAVADGVSGGRSGKVASAQAINLLEEAVGHFARRGGSGIPGLNTLPEYLRYVLERIDQTLKQFSENNVTLSGMGTTVTAAVIEGDKLHVAHAGDSRAYLFRRSCEGSPQITEDDAGDEAGPDGIGFPPTNGLGCICDTVRIHLYEEEIHEGDVLLLCTDGLWRAVSDEESYRILLGSPAPGIAVDRLMRAANLAGGRGNIGVVVAHLGATNFADDPELDRLYPPGAEPPPERSAEVVALAASGVEDPGAERADGTGARVEIEAPARVIPGRTSGRGRGAAASPFMRGVFYGAVGTLLLVLLVAVTFEVVKGAAARRAGAPPSSGKAVPVGVWSQKGFPWRSPRVEYKIAGGAGQEDRWVPIPEGETNLNIAGSSGATLALRISSDVNNETGEPFPSWVSIKIGRTETQPTGVVVPDFVPDAKLPPLIQRVGQIVAFSTQPGSAILESDLIRQRRKEAQLVREGSRYSVRFDHLPPGIYSVRRAPNTPAAAVKVAPDDAIHRIDLDSLKETAPSRP